MKGVFNINTLYEQNKLLDELVNDFLIAKKGYDIKKVSSEFIKNSRGEFYEYKVIYELKKDVRNKKTKDFWKTFKSDFSKKLENILKDPISQVDGWNLFSGLYLSDCGYCTGLPEKTYYEYTNGCIRCTREDIPDNSPDLFLKSMSYIVGIKIV